MSNPFTPGSTQFQDFETLSDLKWHCSKCELQSGQAKTWQVWRQERGVQFDTDEKGNYYKKIMCPKCGTKKTEIFRTSDRSSGKSGVARSNRKKS